MLLYLVQHGEAVPEAQDPERPLTAMGRADIERLAGFLGQSRVRVGRVVHSGKLRARDSASMLGDVVGIGAAVEIIDKLLPGDSTEYLAQAVEAWRDDTLVVGHQPFMSRFVSRLVLGSEQPMVVDFTPGTAVCLARRSATGAWFINWMVTPDLLRR